MIVHDYIWRGFLIECVCGHHFHVDEDRHTAFACRCGANGGLSPTQVRQAIDGPGRAPGRMGRRSARSERKGWWTPYTRPTRRMAR